MFSISGDSSFVADFVLATLAPEANVKSVSQNLTQRSASIHINTTAAAAKTPAPAAAAQREPPAPAAPAEKPVPPEPRRSSFFGPLQGPWPF